MQYLLSQHSRAVLARLAQERALLAFDFDGTLAPIVEHPNEARMRRQTRDLLACLAATHPCVIISGRTRADVASRLGGVDVARVIGNHGAESEAVVPGPRGQVTGWKRSLEPELRSLPGVWVEDKGYSLAVHYRQSRRKTEARRRILAVAQTLDGVRVIGGKQVVNLLPEHAPRKGQALTAERDRLACQWVLYVGDDENDEDAFAIAGNIVPVRIGRKHNSHARYYLRSQLEIDGLLKLLCESAKN